MDQYEHIRIMSRVYKKGIRKIARDTGHHRKTIRKALEGTTREYRRTKPVTHPVMGPFESIVEAWLKADQEAPRKQRHTAKRIYTRLVEEHGFEGGESTVRQYVRKTKEAMGLNTAEAMVPLEADMGEAEMDWGEAQVKIGGEMTTVKMFCMRSRYSGKSFVQLYHNERQQMLFDGHTRAFAYYGGVFPVVVYDNMKTAVKQVLKGRKRVEQAAFQRFRAHYTFQSKFCNIAKGNEKGGVEGLVKFSRQNFLVPIPEADSLESLNQLLLEKCEAYTERVLGGREDKRTVEVRDREEKAVLLPLVAPYEMDVPVEAKVDKYQMVQVDKNRYSTPGCVGKTVTVYAGCQKVKIYRNSDLVAEHERVFTTGRWILDPCHYLKLLERKVRAFDNAKPIRQWRQKWPTVYEQLLTKMRERDGDAKGTRAFLRVLRLHEDYEVDEVETAVALAWENGTYHADAIKMILQQLREDEVKPPGALEAESLREHARITVAEPDTAKYDLLTEEVA